jgi:ribonuclease PH
VQGTAEGMPFTRAELDEMVSLGEKGIAEVIELQQEMVAGPPPLRRVVPDRR